MQYNVTPGSRSYSWKRLELTIARVLKLDLQAVSATHEQRSVRLRATLEAGQPLTQ